MDESVVMVSGVLKEVGIDNAQGDTPLLVGYIRVDVPCSYDMENGRGYTGWMNVIAVNARNVMMSISLVLYIFPSFVFFMYQTAHQIPDIHSDGK